MLTSSPKAPNDSPSLWHEGDAVEVVIPAPLPTPLTYRVGEGQTVTKGSIVKVPLGTRQVLGTVWGPAEPGRMDNRLKPVIDTMDVPPVREPLRNFIAWVADWTLAAPGMVAKMVTRGEELMQREPPILAVRRTGEEPAKLTDTRRRVLEIAKPGESFTKTGLADLAGVSVAVIDGLVKAGVFEKVWLEREPGRIEPNPDFDPRTLTGGQADAVEALIAPPTADTPSIALLEGVTGSGKTEVYFEAVANTLRQGRQVLILLPEIALTQALLDRFAERFGALPGEWHSAITPKARRQVWRGTAEGKVKVVIGARSALYLPFEDLGLVIVDEEHEAAYKQEEWVSYNARDMAIVRAKFEGAQTILASATPSVESRVNAQAGRYQHILLPARYAARPLPSLSAIDMRRTPPERGSWLAPPLIEAVHDTLERGEQSLIFLNRRGYAPLTLCRTCGHRFECSQCSAWLVQHRFTQTLNCHHCGHVEKLPDACPECGSTDTLAASGPGVERIAEEVATRFPDARSLVLSSDMIGGPKRLKMELEAVANGEVDIVIGTQLVAKGHNFPGLTLVGVVDADVGFGQGDPRAAERTFQLLTQVTGRAGRADKPGMGLIQTYMREHPVLGALLAHDTERFYQLEEEARRRAHLPPFVRFVAVVVSASDASAARTYAANLKRSAPTSEAIEVLGPVDAPMAMLRGRHRQRLLVRGPRGRQTQTYVRQWLAGAEKARGDLRVDVDVDPQSFI
ncbi:MAG: primosomal protein N' [Devosiaceae bacterium]|nr:primosomal protein N' [Devosiaceae bacterium MH13]